MKKIFFAAWAVMALASCNNSVEKTVTGVVYDATMNGVTVIAENNDTVFVSTIDAKDAGYNGGSFALNDTLTIQYRVADGINMATAWQVKLAEVNPLVGAWTAPINGIPGEDGILLNADGTAESINMATLLYKSWKRDGDKIVMDVESIGNGQTIVSTETMTILKLDADSLVLDNDGAILRYHKAD